MVDEELLGKDLSGKVIVVTGGNSGIGLSTVKQLAKMGAHVVLCARKLQVAETLAKEITEASSGTVEGMQLDLASFDSIKRFSEALNAKHPAIDILVNNAGIMHTPFSRTAEGLESQFGVNHLGHFLLSHLLLKSLSKSEAPRLISVSSAYHNDAQGRKGHICFDDLNWETRKYDSWAAYAQSKLANLLFAREAAKRWPNITSVSLHPGFVRTNLINATVPTWLQWLVNPFFKYGNAMIEPWEGIQAHLHCLLSDNLENGCYYSQTNSPKGVVGGFPCTSPNEEAHNDDIAARLWDASEKLVGL